LSTVEVLECTKLEYGLGYPQYICRLILMLVGLEYLAVSESNKLEYGMAISSNVSFEYLCVTLNGRN